MLLGGVMIPAAVRCTGHSDADAVCHALTDAILGGAGVGDIGEMFPDTSAENAGRDSIEMLRLALARVQKAGWTPTQCDITVIAETPKLGPHRAQIAKLGAALGIPAEDVMVKGKTNERMGWIGRARASRASRWPRSSVVDLVTLQPLVDRLAGQPVETLYAPIFGASFAEGVLPPVPGDLAAAFLAFLSARAGGN